MEQQLLQWGPAGFVLLVLGLVVKWLMAHIDALTKNTNELVLNHLSTTADAMNQLSTGIQELKEVIKGCGGRSPR